MGRSRNTFSGKGPTVRFPAVLRGVRGSEASLTEHRGRKTAYPGPDAPISSLHRRTLGFGLCVSTPGHRVSVRATWRLGRLRWQHGEREEDGKMRRSRDAKGSISRVKKTRDGIQSEPRGHRCKPLCTADTTFSKLLTGFGGVCLFPVGPRPS